MNKNYRDTELDYTVSSEDGTEIMAGQLWKDSKRKPTYVFLVTSVQERFYTKHYDVKARTRLRVIGTVVGPHVMDAVRSIDVESLRKMYPHLMWEPTIAEDTEGNK